MTFSGTYRDPYEATTFPSKRVVGNYNLQKIVSVTEVLIYINVIKEIILTKLFTAEILSSVEGQ